jgi:hypothetical protein
MIFGELLKISGMQEEAGMIVDQEIILCLLKEVRMEEGQEFRQEVDFRDLECPIC